MRCSASPAVFRLVGKDHLAHCGQTIGVKEHMFGPAQPDPLGVEPAGGAGIRGGVGIGANADSTGGIRPVQQSGETVIQRRFQQGCLADKGLARTAIDSDHVAFLKGPPLAQQLSVAIVDDQIGCAHDAGASQPARDHRSMAGRAATFCQHGDRGMHAANILGHGLAAHQHTGFSACGKGLCRSRIEHDPARGRAGAGIDATHQHITW